MADRRLPMSQGPEESATMRAFHDGRIMRTWPPVLMGQPDTISRLPKLEDAVGWREIKTR